MIKDAINILDKVSDNADRFVESGEERQSTLTERQKIDMTSPFKLPQLIRPVLAIWSALTFTLTQWYCIAQGLVEGDEALLANGVIMSGIIGFYFQSRKAEKVSTKKFQAEVEIQKMNAEASIKIEESRVKMAERIEKENMKQLRREKRLERRRKRVGFKNKEE